MKYVKDMPMDISEQGKKGKSSRGNRAATLKDIAERCGVSKWAVSLALRGDHSISQATTARIRAVAEELHYSPAYHEAARRMALRRDGHDVINNTVALFYPNNFSRYRYYSDIFFGMTEVLGHDGYFVTICPVQDAYDRTPYKLSPAFSRGDIDAVLIYNYDTAVTQSLLDELRHDPGFAERPVVSLCGTLPDASNVITDDYQGAYETTKHLLNLGHRSIMHFVTSFFGERLEQRLQGARQALQEHGVDPERHLHLFAIPDEWFSTDIPCGFLDVNIFTQADKVIAAPLPAYLRAHPDITAIMALNDASAQYTWHSLQHAGIRIPDEISIVGFDDTDPMLDSSGQNLLSSVRLPLIELGKAAANLLVHRITKESTQDENITLPVELIIRKSIASVRQ